MAELPHQPDEQHAQPELSEQTSPTEHTTPPEVSGPGEPVRDPYIEALLDESTRDPHEGAVPPGYDWPTHGGYLGCLLGLVAACVVAGFLGGTWIPLIAAPSLAKVVISLVVVVAGLVGLGRLGWVLGKRFYREYPQPTPMRRLSAHERDSQ